MLVWSADEARLRLSLPSLTADVGVARGVPLVLVEADGGPLPVVPASFPAIVLGIDLDGDLDGELDVDSVAAAVLAHPQAAVVLAQLLRVSVDLPVPGALVAESLAYGVLQAGPEHRAWLATRGRRVRPQSDDPPVLVDDSPDRVRLTLNRPRIRNPFSAAMRDALVAELRRLQTHGDGRPIDLTGSGPAFCVGGDLAEFGTVADPSTAHHLRMATSAGLELWRVRERLTARVHGACVGAGVELAAFAGRVEASADTVFSLPELGLGLVPGAGGTVSLPRRIGRQRTLWMALTGTRIDATTALAWGLVDALV